MTGRTRKYYKAEGSLFPQAFLHAIFILTAHIKLIKILCVSLCSLCTGIFPQPLLTHLIKVHNSPFEHHMIQERWCAYILILG